MAAPVTPFRITTEITVEIDPAEWESAGYPPLDDTFVGRDNQIREWLSSQLHTGGHPIPTEVHSLIDGSEPRPVNAGAHGFHMMTITGDGFNCLTAEDINGHKLASAAYHTIGDKSDPLSFMALIVLALAAIES